MVGVGEERAQSQSVMVIIFYHPRCCLCDTNEGDSREDGCLGERVEEWFPDVDAVLEEDCCGVIWFYEWYQEFEDGRLLLLGYIWDVFRCEDYVVELLFIFNFMWCWNGIPNCSFIC